LDVSLGVGGCRWQAVVAAAMACPVVVGNSVKHAGAGSGV